LKKILLFSLVCLFWANPLFSQDVEIKSLKAYLSSDEISLPVITYSKEARSGVLSIEFDLDAEFIPNLNIVFRYCDRNWKPTQNIFLLNEGKNTAYFLDLTTLPTTVEDARYHFRNSYPNSQDEVEFPFSGKWMFFITESSDTSIVYATGKFYVVYEDVGLSASIKREQLEDRSYFPADLAKIFNITTNFNLPDELYPSYVNLVEIVENHKTMFPIVIDKTFNTNTRQYYWDGNRKFSFTARDIYPGNGYRQADLRNVNKFNSKNVRAQFDGIESSRFFQDALNDLNGGSIFTNYKDDFATYLNVSFSVRPPEELKTNLFLVGAFNEWQLLPEYEMKNESGLYKITISLKRGVYDYQYVAADVINGKIQNDNWVVLEGNNWEAENEYHLFLYYNDPEFGGYERIIGYQKVISR
jgi:hypothetical protein